MNLELKFVDVTDELPEDDKALLVIDDENIMYLASYGNETKKFYLEDYGYCPSMTGVVKWAYLPTEEELKELITTKKNKKMKKEIVIVRANRSGVFFGELSNKKGSEVTLLNARKLYYWSGAAAVEQLALDGVKNPEDCKFTVTVSEMTVLDAIQILPCTGKSIESINGVKVWKR